MCRRRRRRWRWRRRQRRRRRAPALRASEYLDMLSRGVGNAGKINYCKITGVLIIAPYFLGTMAPGVVVALSKPKGGRKKGGGDEVYFHYAEEAISREDGSLYYRIGGRGRGRAHYQQFIIRRVHKTTDRRGETVVIIDVIRKSPFHRIRLALPPHTTYRFVSRNFLAKLLSLPPHHRSCFVDFGCVYGRLRGQINPSFDATPP